MEKKEQTRGNTHTTPWAQTGKTLPLVFALLAILRIGISRILGVIFLSGENFDDVLLLSYAALKSHFQNPQLYGLCKTMVYPLFLDLVYASHLPYDVVLSLLYLLAALVVFFTVRRVLDSRKLAVFSYVYVLFLPQAFDAWGGLRIYRNALIPPCLVILFSLLVRLLFAAWKEEKKGKHPVAFGLLLGVVFTVSYYIREDGIWLLACLLVAALFSFAGNLVRLLKIRNKENTVRLLSVLLPFIVFGLVSTGYRAVNEHYFGVRQIETRTAGAQGGFVKRLFTIDSEHRTSIVWTPFDVVEQAFAASPTLSAHPKLLKAIETAEDAGGDMKRNPITGERMGWLLKEAMLQSGLYENEASSEAFFSQVNKELDTAFRKGTLKKSSRIQLLSSGGGFTVSEILALRREMAYGFLGTVALSGYQIGAGEPNVGERQEHLSVTEFAARLTREPSLLDFTTTELTGTQRVANAVLSIWFKVVGLVNILLFVLSFGSLLRRLPGLFIKEEGRMAGEKWFSWLLSCGFFGIGLVYLFGISWFSHFIWGDGPVNTEIFNFYLIALPVIWLFFYLLTVRETIALKLLPRAKTKD